jgi:hypothetical protein
MTDKVQIPFAVSEHVPNVVTFAAMDAAEKSCSNKFVDK